MSIRRLHQNIKHNKPTSIPIIQHESISYDEDQPPHPKTFVQSPVKWANSRINQDMNHHFHGRLTDMNKYNNQVKSSTARQRNTNTSNTSRLKDKNYETGKFTALNSSRNSFKVNAPENDESPRQPEQLFVPDRNKFNYQSKLSSHQRNLSNRNSSFSSHRPTTSPKPLFNKFQIQKSRQPQFPSQQIKLFNPNKTIHHISSLRKYENEQKQRETLLNNRLKFITIGNERDNKKLSMAKRKYEKVVSIRSDFLKQKETINRQKLSNYLDEMNSKHTLVSRVKEHQNSRKLSVSRLSQSKTLSAQRLRQQQRSIEHQILSSKLTDLEKKKLYVKHTQESLEKSRQRISELNKSRISSIRSIQNKSLIKSYLNVQKREKINQKLYNKLQREIKLIDQRKLKAASELKEYESLLGLNLKKSKQINLIPKNKQKISNKNKMQRVVSSTFSTSGSKSFYLTNC